jgi:hypothetical protein
MRNVLLKIYSHHCAYSSFWMKFILLGCFIALSAHALAESGNDLLQGTDSSFWKTLNGTGKKYIYGTEFILAVATYIKSKNLLVFLGVIAIAVFFNILLKFVGE